MDLPARGRPGATAPRPAPAPAPRDPLRTPGAGRADRGARRRHPRRQRRRPHRRRPASWCCCSARSGRASRACSSALAGLVSSTGEIRWNGEPVADPQTVPAAGPGRPRRPGAAGAVGHVRRQRRAWTTPTARVVPGPGRPPGWAPTSRRRRWPRRAGRATAACGCPVARCSGWRWPARWPADAELLLADDVSSALDAATEVELWAALRARRDRGRGDVQARRPGAGRPGRRARRGPGRRRRAVDRAGRQLGSPGRLSRACRTTRTRHSPAHRGRPSRSRRVAGQRDPGAAAHRHGRGHTVGHTQHQPVGRPARTSTASTCMASRSTRSPRRGVRRPGTPVRHVRRAEPARRAPRRASGRRDAHARARRWSHARSTAEGRASTRGATGRAARRFGSQRQQHPVR